MYTKRKETSKIGEKMFNAKEINKVWKVIEEMQKNLDFLNDKIERLMKRVGVE